MNWDQIEGKWKQFSGKAKGRVGRLTDDDLTTISGKRDQLVGKLQGTLRHGERPGRTRDRRILPLVNNAGATSRTAEKS